MREALVPERARRAEGLGHRVEQLSGVQRAGASDAASDHEDPAVGQERGGVVVSSLGQRSNGAEGPARRIPELGRVEDPELVVPTDDQDTTILQERRGMAEAGGGERGRGFEGPSGGVPQLGRCGRQDSGTGAADHEHAAIAQRRRGVP